jgi:histone deacetylase 11
MKILFKKIVIRILIYGSPFILLFLLSFLPRLAEEKNLDYYKNYVFNKTQTPIFYSPIYNISFGGLENLHPFDSKKYSKIYKILTEEKIYKKQDFVSPPRPNMDMVKTFHSKEYLKTHLSSYALAHITEIGIVSILPARLTKRQVLVPMLHAAGGTILATQAALTKGWAINLGGGFHHASKNKGHGFCAFNDLTMAIEIALEKTDVNKVLYVDLDAHQGDGPSTDFKDREDVFIFDMFNVSIFPEDEKAKAGIDFLVELTVGENGQEYLEKLSEALKNLPTDFDLLVYNAGTDILKGDPLGILNIDEASVILRDQMVFEFAKKNKIPIVMTLSGGYQKANARVIADSIINLKNRTLIN